MLGKLWCLGPTRIHGKLAWRAALPAVLLLTSLGLKSPGLGHGQLAILISVCGRKAFQPVSQLFLSRLLCLERPSDKQAQQKEANGFHIGSDLFLGFQPLEVTDDRLKIGTLHLAELSACLSMFYQLLNDIPI